MKILVTGGAGFIGGHLLEELLKHNFERITVLDNFSTGVARNIPKEGRIEVVNADIREGKNVAKYLEGKDFVIHLAAKTSVPESMEDPMSYASTNLTGLLNVLHLSARAQVRRFIYISSCAVYGDCGLVGQEDLSPNKYVQNHYALQKYLGELYTAYCRTAKMIPTSLRLANVYGERQLLDRGEGAVVPSFMTAFLNKRNPIIFGDGSQTRDFIYVKDVADAIVRVMFSRAKEPAVYNVGTGREVTITQLCELMNRFGRFDREPAYAPVRKGDIHRSILSVEKLRCEIGWTAKTSIEGGLKKTMALWG